MKVRKSIIEKLSTNKGLALIMTVLDVSHSTARTMVKDNAIDGDLTKISMLKAMEQEYKLPADKILLDEKTAREPAR